MYTISFVLLISISWASRLEALVPVIFYPSPPSHISCNPPSVFETHDRSLLLRPDSLCTFGRNFFRVPRDHKGSLTVCILSQSCPSGSVVPLSNYSQFYRVFVGVFFAVSLPVLAVLLMAKLSTITPVSEEAEAVTVVEEASTAWALEVHARRTRKITPPYRVPRPLKVTL